LSLFRSTLAVAVARRLLSGRWSSSHGRDHRLRCVAHDPVAL